MDNAQQRLTRIEGKINLIGGLVIGLSAFFTFIAFVEIIAKDVETSWKFILIFACGFLVSAWTIYMNKKFREAGRRQVERGLSCTLQWRDFSRTPTMRHRGVDHR